MNYVRIESLSAKERISMMQKIRLFLICTSLTALLSCATATHDSGTAAANGKGSPATKERELIQVLNSKAPPEKKAITCKQLAIYGNEEAVPALAPLLADAELASWARIALEAIPGPATDDALRKAMGKLQGRLLIGTINSIGYRRDAKAVNALAKKLKDSDAEVASASAVALGHIGGAKASKTLERLVANAPAGVRI